MKTTSLVVALACLSLGLTAAIAYVSQTGSTHSIAAERPATFAARTGETAAPKQPAISLPPSRTPASKFSWGQLESDDYHVYIANLRAMGCPEQTIRDIIIADVNRLFAARENPLKLAPQTADTNKVSAESIEQRLERLRQLRAVQQEKRWVVKELLGVDVPLDLLPSSGSRDYHSFEVALGQLPEEKRDAVQALQENYWQQSDALKGKNQKKKTPDTLAEARQLTDSLHQELAKVLTPQELEDYELRTSSTAKTMADKLASYFRPSEDEFRKIYRAKREYDDAIEKLSVKPAVPTLTEFTPDGQAVVQNPGAAQQALNQARANATTQLNEQLKAALGDDRYNEYQRSQDRSYDLLARLGTRYNLPADTVLQAYELQKSFAAGAQAPGAAGQQADRAALQQQLDQQMTAILGDQAARGYKRVNGGTIPIK